MRTAFVVAAAVLCAVPAAAQGRFQTGIVGWTPTLTLRDAGFDTNVFDESQDPKRDTVAVFAPRVDAVIDNGTWTLAAAGNADFVYFERYTNERSINRGTTARFDLKTMRIRPFASAGYLDARERQGAEIDLRARRAEHDVSVGTAIQVFSRTGLEVAVRRSSLSFREGQIFRAQDLAHRLNRTATGYAGRLRLELSPLTSFRVEGELSQDRFAFRPGQDTDTYSLTTGLEFAPDAIVRGRATVGYKNMQARGDEAFGYSGLTAAADLSFVLLGRTRFDGKLARDTAYSVDEQPYYLRTLVGGEVTHNLFGAIDVVGRASRERLDYPTILERALVSQIDYYNAFGGGLVIRPGERLSLSLNYEFAERNSGESADFSFTRRRMYTVITYGF